MLNIRGWNDWNLPVSLPVRFGIYSDMAKTKTCKTTVIRFGRHFRCRSSVQEHVECAQWSAVPIQKTFDNQATPTHGALLLRAVAVILFGYWRIFLNPYTHPTEAQCLLVDRAVAWWTTESDVFWCSAVVFTFINTGKLWPLCGLWTRIT